MLPVLYKCSFFSIYTYGVFVALAFMVSSWLVSREAKRRGQDDNAIYNLCVLLLVSGIVSARLFYVVLNWDVFSADLLEVLRLQHGGLVWFGGLIGASLSALVYMKAKKLSVIPTLDLFAPYAALGQAVGRIGCFFNGCCYGRESGWGFYFPVHGASLVPSQLFDAASLLLVFVVLRLIPEKAKAGLVFSAYLVLATLQRFFLEYLRGDERPFYSVLGVSLSVFQWISVFLFCVGILYGVMILWKKKSA